MVHDSAHEFSKCDMCNKHFSTTAHLSNHIMMVHQKTYAGK